MPVPPRVPPMSLTPSDLPGYPFAPQRFEVRPGIVMRYLDEGPREAPVVVMLHGNPSWSYYWRHLVAALRDRYRCIVPDHVGMGLSDKPDDRRYPYTLGSRIEDLDALLAHLGIAAGGLTLAVHDWGGGIGFGWAAARPSRVARLVILNTGSFPLPVGKPLPKPLKFGRDAALGEFVIRRFNAFAAVAARVGVARPMPPAVRRAYLAPYDSWAHRIAVARFVQDIPLGPGDPAWPWVEAMARRLPEYADRPVFIGWGLKDFVFDHHFLKGFTDALPGADVHAFEDAGHYVLEDKAEVLVPAIRAFLDRT